MNPRQCHQEHLGLPFQEAQFLNQTLFQPDDPFKISTRFQFCLLALHTPRRGRDAVPPRTATQETSASASLREQGPRGCLPPALLQLNGISVLVFDTWRWWWKIRNSQLKHKVDVTQVPATNSAALFHVGVTFLLAI